MVVKAEQFRVESIEVDDGLEIAVSVIQASQSFLKKKWI